MRLSLAAVLLAAACGDATRTQAFPPPLSAEALQLRLYAYAHDSMAGRKAGTPGNDRATDYIAAELRAIGLEPAGENGTWFQTLPLRSRLIPDSTQSVRIGGRVLLPYIDYLPRFNGLDAKTFDGSVAVYAGVWGDTAALLAPEPAAGKVVVVGVQPGQVAVVKEQLEQRYSTASAIAVANLDELSHDVQQFFTAVPVPANESQRERGALPSYLHLSAAVVAELFGTPMRQLEPGAPGSVMNGRITFIEHTYTARNVVALLRGNDPILRNQYVAIGSHSDHEGIGAAVDSDSLRAFNMEVRRRYILEARGEPTSNLPAIRVNMDSIRALNPVPRRDSIYNGADDDGSGTVAMIEIARAMASDTLKPRRSILFVFHTAEEDGLVGSAWYSEQPTVPLDSIVAHINLDMIGRGGAADEPGGGPSYLQLIGARRISTELGDVIEQLSRERSYNWHFDKALDAPGHAEQVYCRSDHFNYARFGIPVAFLSTGTHADYHQVTDQPDKVDYTKLALVASFVHELLLHLANRDHRLVLNGPRPDPAAPCVH